MVWTCFKVERGENCEEGFEDEAKRRIPKMKNGIRIGATG
jgi:hypothetical protein